MKSISLSFSTLLASFILGVSFIIGSVLIINQDQGQRNGTLNQTTEQESLLANKVLLTLKETATYLGMSEDQVMSIIKTEQGSLNAFHHFEGKMFPFIKVQDQMYVSRVELELWIQDASSNHRRYIDGVMQ
ncbi:helix-turn-helix domain-containing protein [Paenibacillus barcinonensis]|uniref:helix-turn-helix domain-containing protein n=1 Tax=Paenibacillus barcinonensis TaxID=198119 RepID=UPI001C0FD46F|nr:helix-turn-helix domain-containing protein [Paenibacillus barcinonensis]MBU5356269.1 helix-turn-helix domain-containing protein [Paenibacillus barcinonensis]